jgi:hypothetical protein
VHLEYPPLSKRSTNSIDYLIENHLVSFQDDDGQEMSEGDEGKAGELARGDSKDDVGEDDMAGTGGPGGSRRGSGMPWRGGTAGSGGMRG